MATPVLDEVNSALLRIDKVSVLTSNNTRTCTINAKIYGTRENHCFRMYASNSPIAIVPTTIEIVQDSSGKIIYGKYGFVINAGSFGSTDRNQTAQYEIKTCLRQKGFIPVPINGIKYVIHFVDGYYAFPKDPMVLCCNQCKSTNNLFEINGGLLCKTCMDLHKV